MRELEPHQRVAGLQQRVIDGRVRLGARVRLHVGVLGAEQRLGPVDRELLGDVDVLAAAVVALARIALGVLVGQHRALALEHRDRHEVLRGDHLERALLALELEREHLGDLGIDLGERPVEEVGRQLDAHRGQPTIPAAVAAGSRYSSPRGPGGRGRRRGRRDDATGSGRSRSGFSRASRGARPRRRRRRARRSRRHPPRTRADRRPSTASPAARRRRSPDRRRAAAARGHRRACAGPEPPARFALDCSAGQRTSAKRSSAGTRSPSVPGSSPHASGNRPAGFASSTVQRSGSSRSSAARVRGPSSGSATSASSRSKNITAEGFASGRRLSR